MLKRLLLSCTILLGLTTLSLSIPVRPTLAEPIYHYVNHDHILYQQDIGDALGSDGCTYDITRTFYDKWDHEINRFTNQWTGREYFRSGSHYSDSLTNRRRCPIQTIPDPL